MKKLSTYYEDLVLDPKANCFCMLKPGFVKYKDEFEKLLRAYGWKICKTCTKLFTRPEIEEFYICHKDKGFYNKLCDYMITEACQCYAVYKHIKNPVKDMESFKEKIRQEWGEDEMRNGMHSSDSDDNVKREIELAFNCVNERLVLSKNKQRIAPEDFYNALKLYTGKYKLENIYGSFSLEEYHKDNDIDPGFFCFDENDNGFAADVLLVEDNGGTHIRVIGENQAGKILNYAFNNFNEFIELLDRYGEHRDDPTTGEEHLQNIYDILIKNQ
jgi:nucleoside diphosphate kinase